jgi:hypothetical protein
MCFQKNQIFAQNPQLLAYDFTEIASLEAKTDWNSVLLGRDLHTQDWLYITVPYMSFYGF